SGSLESITTLDDPWIMSQYTGGLGVQSVMDPNGTSVGLDWDDRGRLTAQSGVSRAFTWNGDDLPEVITTPLGTETRVYDALGRMVRVTRNGESVDILYAGWTPMIEANTCGQRSWWQGGGLDSPSAYSLLWDASCDETTLGTPAYEDAL